MLLQKLLPTAGSIVSGVLVTAFGAVLTGGAAATAYIYNSRSEIKALEVRVNNLETSPSKLDMDTQEKIDRILGEIRAVDSKVDAQSKRLDEHFQILKELYSKRASEPRR